MYTLPLIFIIFTKYSQCCDCNLNKTSDTSIPQNLRPLPDKRQIPEIEYDSSDFIETASEYVEDSPKIKNGGLRTHLKLNNTEFSTMEDTLLMCPYFKPGQDLNFEKMVDVWRLEFFKAAAELGCFNILLKNLNNEIKKYFAEKYGDFNQTVKWDDCVLQLTSGRASPALEQIHLLQRISNNSGLLSNIIITEEYNITDNTTTITLQDHSPDQWILIDNLLLMRDCDNGDVVVFSRVPFDPSESEITDALDKFGEEVKDGFQACRGNNQAVFDNPRYQILS